MSYLDFDPAALSIIQQLYPQLTISAISDSMGDSENFREEENYEAFLAKEIKGIEFFVAQGDRDTVVHQLQEALDELFTVFCSEQNFGHNPDKIIILQTSDRYNALRFAGCNGINYDLYTEDLITHLQELEKEQPFILTGVGFDFLQGYFTTPIKNPKELAEHMYQFCPDIVDQGTGSVESLVRELKNSQAFYYWWD